jgi:hypothetical protein
MACYISPRSSASKGVVLQFPRINPNVVVARDHGWLHGSFAAAIDDARSIAAGYGVGVISSAGRFAC